MEIIPGKILHSYGFLGTPPHQTPLVSGHINRTWKLETNEGAYILQRVNDVVFPQPDAIARNITRAREHLSTHHPEYLFPEIVSTGSGEEMAQDDEGHPWRLTRYIPHTVTIDTVTTEDEAYKAAHAFGTLTKNLSDAPIDSFEIIIPRFHDLSLRLEQFDEALKTALPERALTAAREIEACANARGILHEFNTHTKSGVLRRRIHHHDTKINNVLFDERTKETVAVIDLDTLMPGYFTSDVGDMIRTFVSVYENERDLSKVVVRKNIYDALSLGYLDAMGDELSDAEKKLIPFSGRFMTYMLGLRMLTDYLNNDRYFHVDYPEQNLDRAKNQLRLFELLSAHEKEVI